MAIKSFLISLKRKLKMYFLIQLIYFFEDDALTHLKTKMPIGHRYILQNQAVIAILLTAAFPAPFIITGVIIWLIMTIQFFLIYVLGVWAYFVVLVIVWLKMTGWHPGGSRDLRVWF